MTTNMNFGPEWMRGSLPKRSNTLDSQNVRSLAASAGGRTISSSNVHSLASMGSSAPSTPLEDSVQGHSSEALSSGENPFKYSKEFMLSLYKPVEPPAYFERHEYVAVEESQGPLSFVDLTDDEKKLLGGPVHSEVGRRMMSSNGERGNNGQRNNSHRELYGSPLHSPASENTPGTPGRMNMSRSKGRMHDYFSRDRDQYPKRHDHDGVRQREWSQPDSLSPNKSREDDQEEQPAWGGVNQDSVGSFDSNGVFRVSGNGRDWQGGDDVSKLRGRGLRGDDSFRDAFGASQFKGTGLSDHAMNGVSSFAAEHDLAAANNGPMFGAKKPNQYKWLYCDPQGTVQGPFDAQEMQEWYKAGFFPPKLLVRREDEPQFENLISLIRKVGTDDEPFLAPYPSQQADSHGGQLGGGMPPRALDPFNRPMAASSPLEAPGNGHFFGNSPQSDLLSPQGGLDFGNKYNPLGGGAVNSLSTNFLQQQMAQNPGSPQSPSLLQGPFNSFGSSLLGSRDNASPLWEKPRTPAWLNNNQGDLFGSNDLSGMPPLFRQQQQQQQQQQQPQHSLNPIFGGSNMNSPGLFDYQRVMNEQLGQHQQYMQMLQQTQQQQLQFQQQLQQQLSQQQSLDAMMQSQLQQQQQQQQQQPPPPSQQQQVPSQPSTVTQPSYPATPTEPLQNNEVQSKPSAPNTAAISPPAPTSGWDSAPASGWDSAPGTPVSKNEAAWSQPAAPEPVANEQEVPIEAEIIEEVVQPLSNIRLKDNITPIASPKKPAAAAVPTPTASSTNVPKPVSLREIQAEEMRKQQEAKEQQQKQQQQAKAQNGNGVAATKSGWNVSTSSPWGREQTSAKGPSLREIQEMEAKEAQSRKQAEAQLAAAAAANERSSSPSLNLSWGVPAKNGPVSSPSSSSPAWGTTAAPKKTLREIQQEEEEKMKKKAAKQQQQQAAALASSTSSMTSTKGYAGIAGTAATKTPTAGAGWTTVTNQRSTPKAPSTTTQASAVKQWEVVSQKSTPAPVSAPAASRPVNAAAAVARNVAKSDEQKPPSDEFMRWCRQSLRGLNAGVNADEILQMLLSFPLDNSSAEIIQDIIYANSTAMDGRRFAGEFMKRRRADLAGKLNVTIPMMSSAALDDESAFKVVTKKGKKKQAQV